MDQEIFDWMLLIGRWVHITVAVTWIGTSIFFMWLDRTLSPNPNSNNEGHVGDLWMVHGGGFYHVEKLLMGPTKVPDHLHWFKWESYWTWMSGLFLVIMIFYTGEGTFLLDPEVSDITYLEGLGIGLFALFGSWFFYDFLWERKITRDKPLVGHFFTLLWFVAMTYFLCHTLSGRAAYIHIGGMLGTWMTANVFMRIIPRQIQMVEASRKGEAVNQDWGKNAKNRSTHNTYFTLPVIFIMLSNHFPSTYGHELNWLIALLICAGGAAIRQYFIIRLTKPLKAKVFFILGSVLILASLLTSREKSEEPLSQIEPELVEEVVVDKELEEQEIKVSNNSHVSIVKGIVSFEGKMPVPKKLRLPSACAKQYSGDVYSNEVLVKNGKLENVLIRISKGLEGRVYDDIPESEIELDQKACIYHPRVVGARVGQKVTFINSDPIFHNVRGISKNNKKFNVAMPKKNQRLTRVFSKPDLFMQAKCSVHPWMGAYIAVVDHPFFAVTRKTGSFTLKDLPVGNYTLEAWHEVFGVQTKDFEVIDQKEIEINFIFKGES